MMSGLFIDTLRAVAFGGRKRIVKSGQVSYSMKNPNFLQQNLKLIENV